MRPQRRPLRTRTIAAALSLALLVSAGPALGISLYDVVQLSQAGYSDEDILDLVRATDSRFVLDADSLVALKEAGVSDRVIQGLLEAKAPDAEWEGETHGAPAASGLPRAPPHPARSGVATVAKGDPPAVAAPPPGRSGPFSFYPLDEPDSGAHQHFALSVHGLPILILRSEEGGVSISQRAQLATQTLNRLVTSPTGRFSATHEPAPAVSYRAAPGRPAIEVLRVGRGDAVAYQRRSLGESSTERLASYWAALLNDYTQLFVFGQPPTELAGLHQGESLREIFEGLASSESEALAGAAPGDPERGSFWHGRGVRPQSLCNRRLVGGGGSLLRTRLCGSIP